MSYRVLQAHLILIGLAIAPGAVRQSPSEINQLQDSFNPSDDPHYLPHLSAAAEDRIEATEPRGIEVIRFLWLRTFHAPMLVRVDRDGDSFALSAKTLSGLGGYDPCRGPAPPPSILAGSPLARYHDKPGASGS